MIKCESVSTDMLIKNILFLKFAEKFVEGLKSTFFDTVSNRFSLFTSVHKTSSLVIYSAS